MNARSLPEWIGRTADTAIPPRVMLRVFLRADGRCANCRQETGFWHCDHIIALANGGENRESNLQTLCLPCHRDKTKADVAEKSKVARVRKKHIGIKRKSKSFATNKDGPWKRKISGELVRR